MRYIYVLATMLFPVISLAAPVFVYGPGGPAPAMEAAARAFNAKSGNREVQITYGPTDKWLNAAKTNADMIYSGSENMMTDFVTKLPEQIVADTIKPIYLRPAAILVRARNPDHIRGFKSLLKPGVNIMVVQGAGQTGLWEDIAGRSGHVSTIAALRKNIVYYAPNSALALKRWKDDASIKAWIIYNIWSIAHPGVAEVIPLSRHYVIYRDMGVALTKSGQSNKTAMAFERFLLSQAGFNIFHHFGWSRSAN